MPIGEPFDQLCRLPSPQDNCAVATRRLERGQRIIFKNEVLQLDSTVLEGHRLAICSIPEGSALYSWGLPFGFATCEILPGGYVCNQQILNELRVRRVNFDLPKEPNFRDQVNSYRIDEDEIQIGKQVDLYEQPRTFQGYRRSGSRGVGTRNFIVVLGITSQTSSFALRLSERLEEVVSRFRSIDGVVGVCHTEGGSEDHPNNLEFLVRTLSGFMVHPNVAAVLAIDSGMEKVTNEMLRNYMAGENYPLQEVVHEFMTLKMNFAAELQRGERIVRNWLERVNDVERQEESLCGLRIALQCGGSDAFSGISANPLLGSVAKKVICHGGSACLAETDELIGAESYVLKNVADLSTARQFVDTVERFKERASWHGHTAEGNPSGGNKYRGLYNITLKSIGAAMKLHPDVRMDHVISYGERMDSSGFYFMDSPGNDLESVAGQVASGANMIFFTTGNGSITNFPFVPTIKLMSTTQRYQLVEHEMDINAGRYLEGIAMAELSSEMLDHSVQVASGLRTKGEQAGHHQVSIWRDWRQTGEENLRDLLQISETEGTALPIKPTQSVCNLTFEAIRSGESYLTDQIGLILPTSLCSGQIAQMVAGHLNSKEHGKRALSRYVALVHTEGCGVSGGSSEALFSRTLMGYMTHPMVRLALALEHGCEKTHNDYIRHQLQLMEYTPEDFGWASVQLDGGIERVSQKVERWFEENLHAVDTVYETAGLKHLSLAVAASEPLSEQTGRGLSQVVRQVVGAGGTVVVPYGGSLLSCPDFVAETLIGNEIKPTLSYGQKAPSTGFFIMDTPTRHWVETLTGLGASGAGVMLAHVGSRPVQGHPMIPLIQVSSCEEIKKGFEQDLDLILEGNPGSWSQEMLKLICAVASRVYVPRLQVQGNTDFQLTRGLLGVSM